MGGKICDVCGEPIEEGDDYYELPDGYVICTEKDCLEEWLWEYRRSEPYSLT